jgi:hypothetical protein
MTTPSGPDNEQPTEGVNLGKGDPAGEAPFDPYRFGKPDHPIPAEYAPPGYTGPTIPAGAPYGHWPPQPLTPQQQNPFSNPPGTPYGPPQQPYQYPPQGPYGPGAPLPPPYHGYVQPKTGSGKAVAGLVLGICSIIFCWLSFFDAVFVILGLIFSLIALSEAKRAGVGGRGMAAAGLICTIVGAILAVIITVVLVRAINECGGFGNSNDPAFNQCVRHNI